MSFLKNEYMQIKLDLILSAIIASANQLHFFLTIAKKKHNLTEPVPLLQHK